MFFLLCIDLSGKLGSNLLRLRAAITFFFGISAFLYQNQNPMHQMEHWRQFYASLMSTLLPIERDIYYTTISFYMYIPIYICMYIYNYITQASTTLSPVDQLIHGIFVLVQKDSNAKKESYCCPEP